MGITGQRTSLIGGLLAAIGATACCAGPLVLLSLGISGAWISSLTALEPYRPLLILIALGFLGWAGWRLYFGPAARAACTTETGGACAPPQALRNQRRIFWVVAVAAILLMAFPWYGVYFFA
ncbi:MAG: mercuric transporter MerT family protein [Thiohalorhabdaceae bacterium]